MVKTVKAFSVLYNVLYGIYSPIPIFVNFYFPKPHIFEEFFQDNILLLQLYQVPVPLEFSFPCVQASVIPGAHITSKMSINTNQEAIFAWKGIWTATPVLPATFCNRELVPVGQILGKCLVSFYRNPHSIERYIGRNEASRAVWTFSFTTKIPKSLNQNQKGKGILYFNTQFQFDKIKLSFPLLFCHVLFQRMHTGPMLNQAFPETIIIEKKRVSQIIMNISTDGWVTSKRSSNKQVKIRKMQNHGSNRQ